MRHFQRTFLFPWALVFFLCTAPFNLKAQETISEVKVSGELQTTLAVDYLPSGTRGENEFSLPVIKLSSLWNLPSGNEVVLALRSSDKEMRDEEMASGEPASHAFLRLKNISQRGVLEVGLVENPVNLIQRRYWNFDKMGRAGYTFSDRHGYFADSDAGLLWNGLITDDGLAWSLRLVNGETSREGEKGYYKDLQLSAYSVADRSWGWAVHYLRGAYDGYAQSFAIKERVSAEVYYKREGSFTAGLQWLEAQDPADIINGQFAERVDVTDYLGSSLRARALSLFLSVLASHKWSYFLKYDDLAPAANQKSFPRLKTGLIGMAYDYTPEIRFQGAWEHQWIATNYKVGGRDTSRLILSAAVSF